MAIVWLGRSTFKRKAGRRKANNHVDEYAHERLQTLFIDGLCDDVKRYWRIALHEVTDPEVGPRHVVGNHRVTIDREIGEGGGENTAGFFFGPVKLIPCGFATMGIVAPFSCK